MPAPLPILAQPRNLDAMIPGADSFDDCAVLGAKEPTDVRNGDRARSASAIARVGRAVPLMHISAQGRLAAS